MEILKDHTHRNKLNYRPIMFRGWRKKARVNLIHD